MSRLTPCSACSRHVRAQEPACPFCGGALQARPPERAIPGERLGRSALYALALGLAACGGSAKEPGAPEPPPPVPAANAGGTPIEPPGTTLSSPAPPAPVLAQEEPAPAPSPSGAMAAAYGAPPRPEAPAMPAPAASTAPVAEKGRVEIGAINVKGGAVDNAPQAAEAMRAAFARCYSKGLAVDPGASGQVTLTIRVGLAGQVLGVSVQRTDKVPAQVASCMTVRAGSAEFSPPKGAKKEVALDMTVNLTP